MYAGACAITLPNCRNAQAISHAQNTLLPSMAYHRCPRETLEHKEILRDA